MSTSEFSSFWPSSVSPLVTSSSSSQNASAGTVDECRPMVEYRKRLPLPAKITMTLVMMSAGTLGNAVALVVLCRTGAVEKVRLRLVFLFGFIEAHTFRIQMYSLGSGALRSRGRCSTRCWWR